MKMHLIEYSPISKTDAGITISSIFVDENAPNRIFIKLEFGANSTNVKYSHNTKAFLHIFVIVAVMKNFDDICG